MIERVCIKIRKSTMIRLRSLKGKGAKSVDAVINLALNKYLGLEEKEDKNMVPNFGDKNE